MERIYVGSLSDVPGVVAANTFLAFFMPANSQKFALALLVSCLNYSTGASATPDSMTIRRISSASGGTIITPSTIPRFMETDEDPAMQMISGNPTVATTSRIPLVGYPPPISVGTGTGSSITQTSPGGASFSILPGTGLAFQTAAGNTSQMWNMEFVWQEIYLPPSS